MSFVAEKDENFFDAVSLANFSKSVDIVIKPCDAELLLSKYSSNSNKRIT